ncbi:MAG: hypothetical protein VX608_11465 [Chloroflexota bacterium]|nr:hypothetical protein [Chloroflexota bacterium]
MGSSTKYRLPEELTKAFSLDLNGRLPEGLMQPVAKRGPFAA